MDWHNERYVRLYTRDTVSWQLLPWESRALFPLMLRKADRAGIIEIGAHGVRALAVVVDMPRDIVERGLAGLLENGVVQQTERALVIPNYLEAQEAPMSDRQRQREHREKRLALALGKAQLNGTKADTAAALLSNTAPSAVTFRDEMSHVVTPCHAVSLQPSLPSQSSQPRQEEDQDQVSADAEPQTRSGVGQSESVAAEPPPDEKPPSLLYQDLAWRTRSYPNWTARAAVLWQKEVGGEERPGPGRFGKCWKPIVEQHGWALTHDAAKAWINDLLINKKRARLKPEWFVEDAGPYLEIVKLPLVAEGGIGFTKHGVIYGGGIPWT